VLFRSPVVESPKRSIEVVRVTTRKITGANARYTGGSEGAISDFFVIYYYLG
jgi:hypothetical protein